jgi:hypothetical protein
MKIEDRIEQMLSSGGQTVPKSSVDEAMLKVREQQREKLVEHIGNAFLSAQVMIEHHVHQIRQTRAEEKQIKERLTNLSRALAFFQETNNPLPLAAFGVRIDRILKAANISPPDPKHPAWKVPDDWEPSE